MEKKLTLKVLEDNYSICRLNNKEIIPSWAINSEWYSITKTYKELSIVCKTNLVPEKIKQENNWKSIKVEGVLDFGLVGILSSLSTLMAENKISIFAISTFDTDYILVKKHSLDKAVAVFRDNGYEVISE